MSKLIELINSLTEEHGIAPDFVSAVRENYDADIADIGAANDATIAQLKADHDEALAALSASHVAELESVRNEKFESMQGGDDDDALVETLGDESDDVMTYDTYWEKAE